MKNVFLSFPEFIRLGALALGLSVQMHVFAGTDQCATASSLPALPADISELKFRDFFIMPANPREPELTPKVRALDGRRVRILGYMARREGPRSNYFTLMPVPVSFAEGFDGMGDDGPATLFVHLPDSRPGTLPPHQSGLLVLTGTLSVGRQEESDGRISMVRLQLVAQSGDQAQMTR